MRNKKLRITILMVILLLTLSLFGCAKPENTEELTTKFYYNTLQGTSTRIAFSSDSTYELEFVEESGIDKSLTIYKGTYIEYDNSYTLNINEANKKSYTFNKLYKEEVFNTQEIALVNEDGVKVNKAGDKACTFLNNVLLLNGEKGSESTVLAVTSYHNLINFNFSGNDYEYSCPVNGTIAGSVLVLILGDGSLKQVTITEDMIDNLDSSREGSRQVTISYAENKTYKATVFVGETSNYSVRMQSYLPINTSIEDFIANIDENHVKRNSEKISLNDDEVQMTGFDTSKQGEIAVIVSYRDYKDINYITIYDPDNLKSKDLFIVTDIGLAKGEDLFFTASTNKNNGDNATIDSAKVTVTNLDNNTVGAQVVEFSYGGLTVNKVIFVYDDSTKKHIVDIRVDGPQYINYTNGELDLSIHKIKVTHLDNTTTTELIYDYYLNFDEDTLLANGTVRALLSFNYDSYTFYAKPFVKLAIEGNID